MRIFYFHSVIYALIGNSLRHLCMSQAILFPIFYNVLSYLIVLVLYLVLLIYDHPLHDM